MAGLLPSNGKQVQRNKVLCKFKKEFSCFITKIMKRSSSVSKKIIKLWLFTPHRDLFWDSWMEYILLAILRDWVGLLFRKLIMIGLKNMIRNKSMIKIGSLLEEVMMNILKLKNLRFMVSAMIRNYLRIEYVNSIKKSYFSKSKFF